MAGPPWLDDLDRIPWAQTEHAYGSAGDIPATIREILSGSEEEAVNALGSLSENLNHQGSVYPATGVAVPFVIELLGAVERPLLLARLLGLLSGIVSGAALLSEFGDDGPASDPSSAIGVYERVARGYPTYIACTAAADPDVRMQAGELLGRLFNYRERFNEDALDPDAALSALRKMAELDADPLAKSTAIFALASDVEGSSALLSRLMTHEHEPARVAAAMVIVEAALPGPIEAAVDLLLDTVARAESTDTLFSPETPRGRRWSPSVIGRLRYRIIASLCAWSQGDGARMNRVLPGALVSIRLANGWTGASDLGPILRWLWPGRRIRMDVDAQGRMARTLPPEVTREEITGIKRVVLAAIIDNPGIWEPAVGNTSLAFRDVGLPSKRDEIRRLLTS